MGEVGARRAGGGGVERGGENGRIKGRYASVGEAGARGVGEELNDDRVPCFMASMPNALRAKSNTRDRVPCSVMEKSFSPTQWRQSSVTVPTAASVWLARRWLALTMRGTPRRDILLGRSRARACSVKNKEIEKPLKLALKTLKTLKTLKMAYIYMLQRCPTKN